MRYSVKALLLITSFSTLLICQQAAYKPLRYENFLVKSISSLEAKKAMLEKKLRSTKEHLAQSIKKRPASSAARMSQYTTIIDASQAVIGNIEAAYQQILNQLKSTQEEKVNLSKLGIKNEQEEDRKIQRAQLTLSIADIHQQIQETHRTENFLQKQRARKNEGELKTVTSLVNSWATKRTQLETKLRNEEATLATLK